MDRATEDRERLLIEAAQKDPKRFAELYEDNFARVWAHVIRRVHDRATAQDITSELFHQALANVRRIEGRGVAVAAWVDSAPSTAKAVRFANAAGGRVSAA